MDTKVQPFRLPYPSDEQINILVNANNNIVVNSVAGSGKTTTILHFAQTLSTASPFELILLLTYNKKLKFETRKKIQLLGLRNIEAHSYHSCAVKYYDHECKDDYRLMNVVDGMESKKLLPFTRIIIDEAQDMSELYYKFVCILTRDLAKFNGISGNYLRFAIIGDRFQSIFSFNGADHRFIQYADVIYSPMSSHSWMTCKLSTSYRITEQMAVFVNKVVLKDERLKSIKSGPPVDYIICDMFNQYPSQLVYQTIMQKDAKGNRYYKNDDIFILAPSIKSEKTPVRRVANYLSAMKLPIFIPGSDEEPLDEDVLKSKIVFSTLHQVKGLERKCVFLFGFDQSYFNMYAKTLPKDICPNTIYVALTRAIEKLYIFHHNHNDYLSFIDETLLYAYANVHVKDRIYVSKTRNITTKIAVAELTKHLSAKVIYDAIGFLEQSTLEAPGDKILIPTRVDGVENENKETLVETVAEINGIALAAYFEFEVTEEMTILKELVDNIDISTIAGIVYRSPIDYSFDLTPENLIKLANNYCAFRTDYIYKLNQIVKYNWLTEDHLRSALTRMKSKISRNCRFEVPVSLLIPSMNKCLQGCIDIIDIDNRTLWEIKAVNNISYDHLIQVAIYGHMINKELKHPSCRMKLLQMDEKTAHAESSVELKYKVFNILDGNIIEVKFNEENLSKMLEMLIYAKYYERKLDTDDKFVMDLLAVNAEHIKPFTQKNNIVTINNSIRNTNLSVSDIKLLTLDVDSMF